MQCAICKIIIPKGEPHKTMWIGIENPRVYNLCSVCYNVLNPSDA